MSVRRDDRAPSGRRGAGRGAFTLVELLVSAALVSLIMLLLSQAFGTVSATIVTQKGIAANDRRARLLDQTIRGDLEARTFRDVIPFWPGQDTDYAGATAGPAEANPRTGERSPSAQFDFQGRRSGYFSISENDPLDPTDDVLQFTIDVDGPFVGAGVTGSPLVGRAVELENGETTDANNSGTIDKAILDGEAAGVDEDGDGVDGEIYVNTNQPVFDDGFPLSEGGSSTMAEVAYFLRGGNLYRSVWLIREPYDADPASADEAQPRLVLDGGGGTAVPLSLSGSDDSFGAGGLGFGEAAVGEEPAFWGDFDYSAFYDRSPSGWSSAAAERIVFHSSRSLSNAYIPASVVPVPPATLNFDQTVVANTVVPASLGVPHLRFGSWANDPYSDASGAPKEYTDEKTYGSVVGGAPAGAFLGRFTKAECASDRDTGSPATQPGFRYPGESLTAAASPLERTDLTLSADGTVSLYDSADRREVDLLLAGVREFDVQVLDDGLATPTFVDLGGRDLDEDGTLDAAFAESGHYGVAFNAASQGAGTIGIVAIDDHRTRYDTWHPGLADGTLGAPLPSVGTPPFAPFLVGADGNGDGNLVGERTADPGADDDSDGAPGNPGSENYGLGSAGEVPLRAIRIRIVFQDPDSEQLRQVTIQQPLVGD